MVSLRPTWTLQIALLQFVIFNPYIPHAVVLIIVQVTVVLSVVLSIYDHYSVTGVGISLITFKEKTYRF